MSSNSILLTDATLVNSNFKTALDLACEFGRSRVVDLLLQSDLCDSLLRESEADGQTGNRNSDLLNKEKSSCLHLAAKNGHIDVIKLLLGMATKTKLTTNHFPQIL